MIDDAPVRRIKQGVFQGYLCWDPDRVSETVNMDAASPAPSTLLAVHHPARIRRRAVGSTDQGEFVSEQEVLGHFLDPSHHLMILPILGESGTGKSHLVQWLRAQLDDVPTRRVIYVPRSGTGLRGLIELILDKMEGTDAARLRQQLAKAFSSTDRTQLPVQLLDAIAQELPNVVQGIQGRELRQRRGLASRLPPLLRDEVFRRWFLRPGGVIERFVNAVLDEGVRPVNERSGFAFTIEDFPEPDRLDEAELGKIGGYAARAFSEVSSAPALRQAAAALVTDALERAIPRVFGLTGEITLDAVFRETRRVLADRGVELILLIEDLTRFQGVDRDLIDALLEPPFQDGRRVLCDLRAAVAVTTGYFGRFLDTFATRAQYAGFEFLLDAPYGDASRGWSDEDVVDFVSRYLNATRVGADQLRQQYEHAGPAARTESRWIPSGCDDCPHRAICHEAFGEVDGRGLYPFNRQALRATAASVFNAGQFDPRGLLGRVVHATLVTHADDLQQGRFPSRAFAMAFPDAPPLPGTTTTAAGLHPDRDRREVLLRFWGGAPDRLVDLNPGIHTAFALPPVGVTREPPAEAPHPPRRQQRPEPKPSPSRSLEELVDRWASGQPLPRHATQELQRHLYRAVVEAVPWAALGVRPNHPYLVESSKARVFRQHSVHIEDALGTERAATTVTITLTRDDRDLLHFLARALELGAATALGAHGYAVLQSFVEQVALRVTTAIATEVDPESPQSKVGMLADRLAIGALALGVDGASGEPLELARSVLDDPADLRHATAATRWSGFVNELVDERSDAQALLVDLASTRQGATGQPSAYRIGRVARSLHRLVMEWGPRAARELPEGFHTRLGRISQRDLKVVADDETRRLIELAEALRLLLGDQTLKNDEFVRALSVAVDDAEAVECFPGNPMEFRGLIQWLSDVPLEEWRTLAERVPEPDAHTGARLARIAEIHKLNPQQGLATLKQLDDVLQTAEVTMRHRLDQLAQGGSESPLDLTINAARGLETSLRPEEDW
jgi:hypothetical protein